MILGDLPSSVRGLLRLAFVRPGDAKGLPSMVQRRMITLRATLISKAPALHFECSLYRTKLSR